MLIVAKYFQTNSDYINLMLVSSKYAKLVEFYRCNPISDPRLFTAIETQNFYVPEDEQYRIEGMFRYVYWFRVDYDVFRYGRECDVYKDVELNASSDVKSLVDSNGHCSVPVGVTRIGCSCFKNMPITKVSLPVGIKTIGNEAFRATNIREVIVPTGVTELGDYVFSECWDLKKVSLPDTLIRIGAWCFCFLALPELAVPASVQSVNESSFHDVNTLILPRHLACMISTDRCGLVLI